MEQLVINFSAMPNTVNCDNLSSIVNRVENSVITYADSIAIFGAGEFLHLEASDPFQVCQLLSLPNYRVVEII